MKAAKIVFITLFAIAIAFILTTLVLASVHSVTFTEEIKSWFEVKETVEPIAENAEAMLRIFRV